MRLVAMILSTLMLMLSLILFGAEKEWDRLLGAFIWAFILATLILN